MCVYAQSFPTFCGPMEEPARFLCPWNFPGKHTGEGCHFLLQELFPTQGLNPGLPHCRQKLYPLSHQGRSKGKITREDILSIKVLYIFVRFILNTVIYPYSYKSYLLKINLKNIFLYFLVSVLECS